MTSTATMVRGGSTMAVPLPPSTLLVTSMNTMGRADSSIPVSHPPATLLVMYKETATRVTASIMTEPLLPETRGTQCCEDNRSAMTTGDETRAVIIMTGLHPQLFVVTDFQCLFLTLHSASTRKSTTAIKVHF